MELLNYDYLETLDRRTFKTRRPYPWQGIPEGLTTDGYERLTTQLPALDLFKQFFDKPREHGQQPHNRYTLDYRNDLDLPPVWRDFILELEAPRYQQWLAGMLGTRSFLLNYHWHFTPAGCSVSPHCDSFRKLGSHIFYLNREGEWDPSWGGQTLVLDDHGKFSRKSSPDFADFAHEDSAPSVGNCSLLFRRRGNSWHGVREIQCPEGKMRQVFIVVINANDVYRRVKRWVRRKPPPGQRPIAVQGSAL